ncbi:unnamed protein product [Laminaria digitata]
MSKKQTLLFFSHSSALYGAERSLLDLLIGLDQSRYRLIVALPSEGPLADKLRGHNIEVRISAHQNWMGGKYFLLAAILRLGANLISFTRQWRWIKTEPIDLIYTNTSATPMGGMLSRYFNIPHLWHIREFIPKGTGGKFYYGKLFSFWFIEKASSKVVCNSHQLKKELAPYITADKLTVVHNGILREIPADLKAKKAPSKESEVVLGMIGSIGPNKGIADGIETLSVLKKAGINSRLLIAGDGLPKNKQVLRELANLHQVTDQIEWLGYLDDPSIVYERAHIILICSRWESFGRVAVEAGAAGCPVIASKRGGLLEVIEAGKTGLFYEPGNIAALTNCIDTLLKNPDLYQQISQYASKSVHDRFTTEKYVSKMVDIIQDQLTEAHAV